MAPDPAADSVRFHRRGPAIALVVVASVLAFVAIFAVWINRQVLNTDNWTNASSEMLEDPVIRGQLAAFITDQIYANVDVEAEIRNALPPRADGLAGAAASALRNQVEKRASQALTRPRVQELWEDANRESHELLLQVLAGGGTVTSTRGGNVTLNLKALLNETDERIGLGGRIAKALPASATAITILRSDQLDLAQDAYSGVKALPIILVVLSLGLFGVALLIAPGWRRRAVRSFGIGLVLAGALALLASSWVDDLLVSSLASTAAMEPTIRHVYAIYSTLLDQAAVAAIAYGVFMVLGAWLAGPTRWAVAVRRALAPYLREPAWAWTGFALLIVIIVLWWAPTPAMHNPVTALVLIALVALGFEGLRRNTAREFPGADRMDAARRRREWLAGMMETVGRRTRSGAGAVSRQAPAVAGGASPDVRARGGGSASSGVTAADMRLERLERLVSLHNAGVLDDDEFRVEKARILARDHAAQAPTPIA